MRSLRNYDKLRFTEDSRYYISFPRTCTGKEQAAKLYEQVDAVEYADRGISAQFGCDISAGNVYAFFQSLETAYQLLDPEKPAQLANYGSLDRTASGFSLTGTAAAC